MELLTDRKMKRIFTLALVLVSTLTFAQNITIEPAHSIVDENAVASLDADFFAAETLTEVKNTFNLGFKANPVFGDITITYTLSSDANVTLEIEKDGGQAFALVNDSQDSGHQKVLWDENIGSGNYTIRLIVNNQVETKKLELLD